MLSACLLDIGHKPVEIQLARVSLERVEIDRGPLAPVLVVPVVRIAHVVLPGRRQAYRRAGRPLAGANHPQMFKKLLSAASVCLVLGATTASAAPFVDAGPGPGYFASDNVEFVAHVPLNNDSAGAKLVGDYFYITSSRGLLIYDVTDPVAPALTGFLPLLQQPYFAEEDPDTNGEILL